MYRLQRSCTLRSRAPNLLQSKEEVQYIKSVITDSLSSVQVKTRLACFSLVTSSLLCGNFGTLLPQSTAFAVVCTLCTFLMKSTPLYCNQVFRCLEFLQDFLNFLCRNSGFLFLLLEKLFQESSGSVYYSIFDFQGSNCSSFGATACVSQHR